MPLHLLRLFGWFLLVYLFQGPVRDILLASDRTAALLELLDARRLTFFVTSGLAFFTYSLMSFLLLRRYQPRWRWWRLMALIGAGALVCIGFRALLEELVLEVLTGQGNYHPGITWHYHVLDNLYYAIIFTAIGITYYYVQLAGSQRERAQRAELLRRESELRFFRSQLNPHFLFNTLNNVYAQVRARSASALRSLERLSGLLRYSLYEQQEYVPLQREIDHLTDFIELENLRLPEDRHARFDLGNFRHDWQLPPMLLVPFVENGFKHGASQDRHPVVVASLVETPAGQLVFTVTNGLAPNSPRTSGGGIGIQNVRQRLQLLYPDRHTLTTEQDPTTYTARLILTFR